MRIQHHTQSYDLCHGPTAYLGRRSFLAGGLGALVSARLLQYQAIQAATPQGAGKGEPMSCILLWMNGGPSHLDTWDPKPKTSAGGPFRAIDTKTPSLQVCEHLPRLAEMTDHLCVIRSMTSKEGNHDRARYLAHTGYAPSVTLQHPSLGSWVSHELGARDTEMPHFVCIRGGAVGAGFLGVDHAPLVVQEPNEGLRNLHRAKNVDELRFQQRHQALALLQEGFERQTQRPEIADLTKVHGKARRLMASTSARAFDLEAEPTKVRQAYGNTPFGQGCLMARRLVEAGARFVELTLDGWDTHVDNFSAVKSLCNELDPAFATLLRELHQRDLARRTLVVWMGEFGRTPKITPQDGRDHHPLAWTCVLAGGRTRRGYVHGVTDAAGEKVVANPVTIPDLFATLATLMAIDPNTEVMSPVGRPIAISDKGRVVAPLLS